MLHSGRCCCWCSCCSLELDMLKRFVCFRGQALGALEYTAELSSKSANRRGCDGERSSDIMQEWGVHNVYGRWPLLFVDYVNASGFVTCLCLPTKTEEGQLNFRSIDVSFFIPSVNIKNGIIRRKRHVNQSWYSYSRNQLCWQIIRGFLLSKIRKRKKILASRKFIFLICVIIFPIFLKEEVVFTFRGPLLKW